ncbi:MAG: InlB B-repeat-containing protein, partial [Peptococcaceae bacterium]|nr:InlB B-repeat-containing protein [Peptococcaceae bacterium]
LGWFFGEEVYDFDTAVTGDVTLTAQWEEEIIVPPTVYTVTFDFNDGVTEDTGVDVEEGNKVTSPADPVREGYKFLGWFFGEEIYDFDTAVTGDITLTAQWEEEDEDAEWIITTVPPTCTLQGYTEHHHVPTGGKWYYNYVPALGHVHDQPVWDNWGWYIICDVCGWGGYISRDPNAYKPVTEAEITVIFEGLKGMQVEYYTNVADWKTVGVFDDTCSFTIPKADQATYGLTTIQVRNTGMSYSFTTDGKTDVEHVVPVKEITVIGVSSECSLAIVQNDWVYGHATASVGVPNYFNVIDNGKEYEVQVGRDGYHHLKLPGYNAGDTVYLEVFYNIAIPEGVSNIRISNANWVDTTVWYANYMSSDVITLLKNRTNATLRFDYAGENYVVNFNLDGTNPFDDIQPKSKTPTVVSATPSAYVTKLNGNQNDLTITVTELYSDGTTVSITSTFRIDNNAANTYNLGGFQVFVDTKGNDQIRECRIVS